MLFSIIKYFWRFILIIYEAFIVLVLLLLFLNYYISLWLVYDCLYYIPDSIYYKYWSCKNTGIYLTLNYISSSFTSVLSFDWDGFFRVFSALYGNWQALNQESYVCNWVLSSSMQIWYKICKHLLHTVWFMSFMNRFNRVH